MNENWSKNNSWTERERNLNTRADAPNRKFKVGWLEAPKGFHGKYLFTQRENPPSRRWRHPTLSCSGPQKEIRLFSPDLFRPCDLPILPLLWGFRKRGQGYVTRFSYKRSAFIGLRLPAQFAPIIICALSWRFVSSEFPSGHPPIAQQTEGHVIYNIYNLLPERSLARRHIYKKRWTNNWWPSAINSYITGANLLDRCQLREIQSSVDQGYNLVRSSPPPKGGIFFPYFYQPVNSQHFAMRRCIVVPRCALAELGEIPLDAAYILKEMLTRRPKLL